jgi:hypothetical protein
MKMKMRKAWLLAFPNGFTAVVYDDSFVRGQKRLRRCTVSRISVMASSDRSVIIWHEDNAA